MKMYYALFFIVIAGLAFIVKGLADIIKIYSCKTPVQGFYMENSKERLGRGTVFYCTFSYRYEGKDYYSRTRLGITQGVINNLYVGSQYTIYINEKNPKTFVLKRKPSADSIIYIVSGLLVMIIPVLLALYIMW